MLIICVNWKILNLKICNLFLNKNIKNVQKDNIKFIFKYIR